MRSSCVINCEPYTCSCCLTYDLILFLYRLLADNQR